MANPVFGKSLCSDWFFLGQDFAVRTVSMETVQSVYFCFEAKPANSKFATKTAKKKRWTFLSASHRKCILLSETMETVQSVYFCLGAKLANSTFATTTVKKKCENCHSSDWNYQQKLKRLKFFRNFKDGWRRRTFLSELSHRKCILLSETECHIINNLLTELLPFGRGSTDLALLGPYCHDLGPIFPSTALALGLIVSRYYCYLLWYWTFFSINFVIVGVPNSSMI